MRAPTRGPWSPARWGGKHETAGRRPAVSSIEKRNRTKSGADAGVSRARRASERARLGFRAGTSNRASGARGFACRERGRPRRAQDPGAHASRSRRGWPTGADAPRTNVAAESPGAARGGRKTRDRRSPRPAASSIESSVPQHNLAVVPERATRPLGTERRSGAHSRERGSPRAEGVRRAGAGKTISPVGEDPSG